MTVSKDVRASIIGKFRRDLVGPDPAPSDSDLQTERLPADGRPSRWYLTGFLAPNFDTAELIEDEADPALQNEQDTESDAPEVDGGGGAAGDREQPDPPSATRRFHPSTIGLTVLLPAETPEIETVVTWGDYRTEPPLERFLLEAHDSAKGPDQRSAPDVQWVRTPRQERITLKVKDGRQQAIVVPNSETPQFSGGGLELDYHARSYDLSVPDGSVKRVRALTVFLVNRRRRVRRRYEDLSYVFQARIELRCAQGFVPRYDLSALTSDDPDQRTADLHYRDVKEYGVGRNTSAGWETGDHVPRVWTDPLPCAEVERVAPREAGLSDVQFDMEELALLATSSADALNEALRRLPDLYAEWIITQSEKVASESARRRQTAADLVASMNRARNRIAAGIELLRGDENARVAFHFMNHAIARAARQREAARRKIKPDDAERPKWRPFQLAFVLLNLCGLSQKIHQDREIVDLLFFPTGGGKTEAYLGLAAYTIAHRRITNPGLTGAGVAVIMRYTLRLLTLDQLGRAAGVMCALELARVDDKNKRDGRRLLGDWPIEIGLWVGSDASPNKMGGTNDTGDHTAVTRVRKYRNGQGRKAPAPLKACPWCGTEFTKQSFACVPNERNPHNLEIRCANPSCEFQGNRALPILTVDEPIYARLPAFLVATIDKFAGLPFVGETGAFFGHVDRTDGDKGFVGASLPGYGRPLGVTLLPPDLIIQDELHLISGPLGTVAGLYETVVDQLASREVKGHRVRPKIVASTATVRRANDQIRALFDRSDTHIFPPPGVDRRDSFFAEIVPASQDPARLYLGVAAQGRGPKLVFLRSLTTLLSAAENEFLLHGKAADPYLTALCYFNALKELGGARRIVEDEVRDRSARYGTQRRRVTPPDQPFADRKVREPLELTSRVSTDQVAEAKKRLEIEFGSEGDPVDVALATNMISVGLDITRLGMMVVQGQPKTAAEYIQATSRVGRDHNRPGIVVAVLNLHKPRDRTHFEHFRQFHATFYRAVEATSVTPWAVRALDRALAAIVVATARHLEPTFTPEDGVERIASDPALQARVVDAIAERGGASAAGGRASLERAVADVISAWETTVANLTANGSSISYSRQKGITSHLLRDPLDIGLPNLEPEHRIFTAGRSMRDVEPNVILKVRDPFGRQIANAEDI
jgi:Helicase conserved C-terminal domain